MLLDKRFHIVLPSPACHFFMWGQDSFASSIQLPEIAHSFVLIDEEYSEPNEIENLLPVLSARGILYAYDDRFAETYYLFTDTGEKYYLEQMQSQNSVVHRFKYLGKPWLTSAFERKQRQAIPIENETSDAAGDIEDSDEWEPLPIDRTTSEYKYIVEAVNDAIEKSRLITAMPLINPKNETTWSGRSGKVSLQFERWRPASHMCGRSSWRR